MARWQRLTPLSGVLAVVLWIVGIFLVSHDNPKEHATDEQILAWYKANSNWVLSGGWLFMLGCIAFIWFLAVVRERLLATGNAPEKATWVGLAGGVGAALFAMGLPALDAAAAISKDDISAATAGTAHHLSDGFFVIAELSAVLLFLGLAIAVLRTRAMPAWWAWLMVVVAVVLVIGPIGWAALLFGVPVWTLGTTAMLFRSPGRTEVAPVAA